MPGLTPATVGTLRSVELSGVLDDHGFRAGLVAGAVALLAVLLLVVATGRLHPGRPSTPRRRYLQPPVAGIAMVLAAGIALGRAGPETLLSGRVAAGLVLLVIGPFAVSGLLPRRPWSWAFAPLAAMPGAAVVASSTADYGADWVRALVLFATVIGGALVADFDRANAPAGLGPVLLAVTVVGMYTTLPDTEQIIVVMGATIPLAFVGWPTARARLGPGAYGVVGLLAWVAAAGGRGRPGAVVGAIACLGLMLVEPIVRRARRDRIRSPRRPRSARAALLVALQLVVVLVTARVAGLEASGSRAAAISAVALAAGAAGVAVVLGPWPGAKQRESARSPVRGGVRGTEEPSD